MHLSRFKTKQKFTFQTLNRTILRLNLHKLSIGISLTKETCEQI